MTTINLESNWDHKRCLAETTVLDVLKSSSVLFIRVIFSSVIYLGRQFLPFFFVCFFLMQNQKLAINLHYGII